MSSITRGYDVGLFVQEMVKAEENKDMWAVIQAARKFLPKAQEMENEYFQQRKEEIQRGKNAG